MVEFTNLGWILVEFTNLEETRAAGEQIGTVPRERIPFCSDADEYCESRDGTTSRLTTSKANNLRSQPPAPKMIFTTPEMIFTAPKMISFHRAKNDF